MSERTSSVIPLAAGCLLALLLLIWIIRVGFSGLEAPRETRSTPASARAATRPEPDANEAPPAAANPAAPPDTPAAQLLARLQERLGSEDARPKEAVLTFASAEAYRKFLARAKELGLEVLGRLDALHAVRVRYDFLTALQNDLLNNAADYEAVGANIYVHIPQQPQPEDRAPVSQAPVGNNMLALLGVTGDPSQWGRGVTIAILDSGVMPDPTFGQGRLRYLDIGLGATAGTGAEDGHGTAVTALAAGLSPDAAGVAPSANLLSIRVTDANALSDAFTVAQAILAAVDAGARLINLSLGAYESSGVMTRAIDYASQQGVVIVASAGNDQAAQLTWPAADPRVISVGAVDALEQQVLFSNSGAQLKMTAPGYWVQTAWLDGQRVNFNGTSASAPIVAGAIAAMMSENPGLSATQAWQVLLRYASDGGAPGADPNYGHGVLNLGWAMNRGNLTRIDTAVSSHYYNAATNQMEFVVQNRGAQGLSGLELIVDAGGVTTSSAIPWLNAGATHVVKLPVDENRLKTTHRIDFRSQLKNPDGVIDQVPANNRRASYLTAPPGK